MTSIQVVIHHLNRSKTFLGFFLFLAVFLNGCAGLQTAQDYLLNEKEGLVFFTMTESGQLGSVFELTFVNVSNKKKITVALHKDELFEVGASKQESESYRSYDQPRGRLIVLRLPEAIYKLDRWKSDHQKHGKFSLNASSGRKFRVMAEHALYLGNVHLLNSESKSSLFIQDNREKDLQLFSKRYPRVEKDKILITSKLFLDPAKGRERFFDAYTACGINSYELVSKKRLPDAVEKFRTMHVASKERKISRIDGYRLMFRNSDGPVTLHMKIELSDVSQFVNDKVVIKDWMTDINKMAKNFDVSFADKGYFSEYQVVTNVLEEKRMVYMVVMFDNMSQLIINMTFINPPEYLRNYQSVEEFLPQANQAVKHYQQCVIENLNKVL